MRAAFFNFSKLRTDSSDAGIYGSQGRNDFTTDDVEHYFNYMGMLAVEGTYDRMEQMLSSGMCCQADAPPAVLSVCCSNHTYVNDQHHCLVALPAARVQHQVLYEL
jgi:hypothetical protein